jgi:hypothetical protein
MMDPRFGFWEILLLVLIIQNLITGTEE